MDITTLHKQLESYPWPSRLVAHSIRPNAKYGKGMMCRPDLIAPAGNVCIFAILVRGGIGHHIWVGVIHADNVEFLG